MTSSVTASMKLADVSAIKGGDIVKQNPFGTVTDPHEIRDSAYVSGNTLINQSIYSVASKIFGYETVGAESLVDGHLQLWSGEYRKQNSFGVVPLVHKLDTRSGASNAILGYFSRNGTNGQPVSVVSGAQTLNYMRPILANSANAASLPLAFNVSSIDYDANKDLFYSNYSAPLAVARALAYPVITPVSTTNGLELQHLTLLNHYLAALTGSPSVFLFDGPNSAKSYTKFSDLLSIEDLGRLYVNLLDTSKPVASQQAAIDAALKSLQQLTGVSYAPFEYFGAENPSTVFVVHGSHESTQLANVVSKLPSVGLISIRIPLPFNQEKFIEAIPASTKKLVVLSPANSTQLKADITASIFLSGVSGQIAVESFNYDSDFQWSPIAITKLFESFVDSLNPEHVLANGALNGTSSNGSVLTANTSPAGAYLIWGKDNGSFVAVADKLALSLSLDDSKTVYIRNKFDNSINGGSFQSTVVSAPKNSLYASEIDSANVVLVEDVSLLTSYDVLATAKPGSTILLVNTKPIKTSIEEDFVSKLPLEFKRTLAKNQNILQVVDLSIIEDLEKVSDSTKGFSGDFLLQLAFWRAALPELNGYIVNKLLQANGNGFELLATVLDNFIKTADELKGIKSVEVDPQWVDLEEVKEEKKEGEEDVEMEEPVQLPYFAKETAFTPNPRNDGEVSEDFAQAGYVDLATKITFPEAYNIKKDLRPDLPVKNFIAKVQENKRLTPTEYSRNIFHIEFDITGTGLKYEIGEALGIHGRNSSAAVELFLKFYNVDGDSLIEVANKDDTSLLEIKTARHALTDSVDFLGKPPKRFYESLAEFTADEKEKAALSKLASGEGAEDLKKRQEVECSTYVDILEEFPSARPTFAELIKIISPLKRREYSIASSQKMHPNAVHLLIVVVDWVDPKGRLRYGHCSKYLSDLAVGDELVVSVKPSVMKLPPLSTQPIVMSGLGTGLAPFKAFLEEKIWQKQQGMPIGEIYLFLGSRHKKEEYLYGELWEAWKDAGVLTHIGAAFSRDQPEKIYIQDRIRQAIEPLTDAIVIENGSFYLCGPTWPVPDITACLEDIVVSGAKKQGLEVKDVAKVVEDMKEDGRYILEVY